MNKIYLTLLVLLSFISVNAQTYEFPDTRISYRLLPESENKKAIKTTLYIQIRGDKVFETITETFNKNGKKSEFLSQNAGVETVHSGEMVRYGDKEIYNYDPSGRLSKIVSYDEDGIKYITQLFDYDKTGLLTERSYYDRKGEKYRVEKFLRSSKTHEIESIITEFENDAVIIKKRGIIFNDKNQCTKRIDYESDNSISDTHSFEFNNNGLISKYKNGSGFGYTYEYKYNAKGDWIERQTMYFEIDEKGKIDSSYHMSEYRIISYYDDEVKVSKKGEK